MLASTIATSLLAFAATSFAAPLGQADAAQDLTARSAGVVYNYGPTAPYNCALTPNLCPTKGPGGTLNYPKGGATLNTIWDNSGFVDVSYTPVNSKVGNGPGHSTTTSVIFSLRQYYSAQNTYDSKIIILGALGVPSDFSTMTARFSLPARFYDGDNNSGNDILLDAGSNNFSGFVGQFALEVIEQQSYTPDGSHSSAHLIEFNTLQPHLTYPATSSPLLSQLWLRCETKEFEHRAALTPTTAKKLMDAGFEITVERDPQRIFADEEYENVGCTLAPHNSWPTAPITTPIIGLKELPENDTSPLPHTHIMFAHCYKQQGGWVSVLQRWADGQPTGMLYDLEFLQDERGRRVAAFGYHAGFAGAAVGALALAEQVGTEGEKGRLGEIKPYPNEEALVSYVKGQLEKVEKSLGRKPRALVIGALGRCGSGAVDFFLKAGLREEDVVKWDMAETKKGGPFQEILEVDIFVNCIYLSTKIPSFVSPESIAAIGDKRALRVVVDVSCDTTNPNNPIPIYTVNTTFDKPTVDVPGVATGPSLTVVSIDHLPTLLPREASEAFSTDLLPSLLTLPSAIAERSQRLGKSIQANEAGIGPNRVWREAEALFWDKLAASQEAQK